MRTSAFSSYAAAPLGSGGLVTCDNCAMHTPGQGVMSAFMKNARANWVDVRACVPAPLAIVVTIACRHAAATDLDHGAL